MILFTHRSAHCGMRGYDGLVMSDWYGIKDRPASLLAGNDLAMPETRRDKRTLLAATGVRRRPLAVV